MVYDHLFLHISTFSDILAYIYQVFWCVFDVYRWTADSHVIAWIPSR